MADPISRSARWVATLVAVPVAMLAGVGAFAALGGFDRAGVPQASPSPSRPVATSPVTASAPALAAGSAAVCRALLSGLPEALAVGSRRPVTAGPEQNAAYGDPPVLLACGTGPAAPLAHEDLVYLLSGVCWQAVERPEATVWTTVDREVPVTVTVPRAYPQPGQVVIELVPPVLAAVRPAARVPAGCRD